MPKEPLTESYVNAVCTEPVVDITVRQALEIVADKHPDHPSFIFSHFNQELTNARLLKKVSTINNEQLLMILQAVVCSTVY